MNTPIDRDERLTRLEDLFTHLEHTVQTLNEIVIQQERRLHAIDQTLTRLAFEMSAARTVKDEDGPPADEKPPHY